MGAWTDVTVEARLKLEFGFEEGACAVDVVFKLTLEDPACADELELMDCATVVELEVVLIREELLDDTVVVGGELRL